MTATFCLDCERKIELDLAPEVGQRIKCQHCGVTLEIINSNPLELDWIYDGPTVALGEDWWTVPLYLDQTSNY